MQFDSPPALATSLLQSGIIPFQPPWGSFLVLTVLIALVTNALRPVITWYWHRFQRSASDPEVSPLPDQARLYSSGFRDTFPRVRLPRPTFSIPDSYRNYGVRFRLASKAVKPDDLQQRSEKDDRKHEAKTKAKQGNPQTRQDLVESRRHLALPSSHVALFKDLL